MLMLYLLRSKLVLRLRGGTDQRICMRMGSDISLDL